MIKIILLIQSIFIYMQSLYSNIFAKIYHEKFDIRVTINMYVFKLNYLTIIRK